MLAWILCVCGSVVTAQAAVVSDGWEASESLLEGRVVRVEGAPVAGARLELRTRVPGESVLRGRALSGADGRFRLEVGPLPRDGVMHDSFLELRADGLAPGQLERVYLPPPVYDLGPIVLHAPVELRGRVTDADGRPVAGAELHAALGAAPAPYGDHARRPPVAVADANGEYVCRSLPPGRVTLGASAAGFADRVAEALLTGEPNRVDLVLERERVLRVRASGLDDRPLAEAVAEPLGDLWGPEPWSKPLHPRAFWRGAERADADGWIAVHGCDAAFTGEVRVSAPGHRAALVRLGEGDARVSLAPVRWLEVVASRAGGAPPELYELEIRDTTRAPSWCGNCDDSRLAKLWADSPAVERLAPERWRIAWNGPACYVDGGAPGTVRACSNEGGRASAELPSVARPGAPLEYRLEFEAPARLAGVARTPEGAPVSLRLGVQLSFNRSDWLAVTSDAEGRFEFERLGSGPRWLYSLDDRWTVDDACDRVELVSGAALEDVVVLVHAKPDGRTGRVRGRLRIGGEVPREPVLLALDEVPNQHLPRAYPRGFAWTDAEGRFEISSFWAREYHLLPKHRPASGGGWRDFAAEFPAHDSRWRWTVDVPESGTTEVEIELPPEAEWDAVAPPKDDSGD